MIDMSKELSKFARTAMSAPVVGYDAIAALQEEQHLRAQSSESGQPCEKAIGWPDPQ